MQLILDIGSGKSLPDFRTGRQLIDEVEKRDRKKHQIVFKAQLFTSAPPNIPLSPIVFQQLHDYAKQGGYELTASVFDLWMLTFLLSFKPMFVKIACRPDLYWLIGEVPRKIPVYVSVPANENVDVPHYYRKSGISALCCVRKYPADIEDYEGCWIEDGISDHTIGWNLMEKYNPKILEKHIVLKRAPDNPDSGPFAILPEDLEGII